MAYIGLGQAIGVSVQSNQQKVTSGGWQNVKLSYGIPGCAQVGCAFDPQDPTYLGLLGNCSDCSALAPWAFTGSGYKWYGAGNPPWPGISWNDPQYIDHRWVCDAQTKPKVDPSSNNQYYCCPSGWKLSTYNDPQPCINELDFYKCGPLPTGGTPSTYACCHTAGEWMPKDSSGADPCVALEPLKASQILAPDVVIPTSSQQLISPGLLAIGGLAIAILLVIVYFKD